MDKNEKTVYYERKLIAYEQMVSAYWEILTQTAEGFMAPSDYLLILKRTIPSFLYFSVEVSKKTRALESCFSELVEAEHSKELEPEAYRKAYSKASRTFGDLVMVMREDTEGAKNDSSVSENR